MGILKCVFSGRNNKIQELVFCEEQCGSCIGKDFKVLKLSQGKKSRRGGVERNVMGGVLVEEKNYEYCLR